MGKRKAGRKVPIPQGRVLTLVRRTAMRKGVLGGSRGWAAVAVSAWGFTKLKHLSQRQPEVVFLEELKPGQRLIIANDRPTLEVERRPS